MSELTGTMSGKWFPDGSIEHKKGCKCRFDPKYIFVGCLGGGGYYEGPVNPTAWHEAEKVRKAEEKAAKEAREAQDREKARIKAQAEQAESDAYSVSDQYVQDKAYLKALETDPDRQMVYNYFEIQKKIVPEKLSPLVVKNLAESIRALRSTHLFTDEF